MANKISKLRQGQEITAEFLNKLIDTINQLQDEHEEAAFNKQTSDDKLGEFETKLYELSKQYSETIGNIPNFTELLSDYLNVTNNTYSIQDNINPSNSPVSGVKNLDIIMTNDISRFILGTEQVKEKTIILEMSSTEVGGQIVPVNRLWLYYNGQFKNFSTDNNGAITISQLSSELISISDDGYWMINGEKTSHLARGPQGTVGPRGAEGARGPKGDKGDTGVKGAQGITGNPGKTPIVKFCSADDRFGTNIHLDQFVEGSKYIGLKFVYEEDSQDVVAATPWKFIRVVGDTYYPHSDGTTLYFSTTPPSNNTSRTFNIKGDKGDRGAVGPVPSIKFVDSNNNNDIAIEPISTTVASDGSSAVVIFEKSDFKGDTGERGPQGIQGPKGDTGGVGPRPIALANASTLRYDSGISEPEIITHNYQDDPDENGNTAYFGIDIVLPTPRQGESINVLNQTNDYTDPDTFPNGARKLTLQFDNGTGTPRTQDVFIPLPAAPYIGEDGYWYVSNRKTNVKAQGPKGDDAIQLTIKGTCYVNAVTISVGTTYNIYSDAEYTTQITATNAGECYLANGYLMVAKEDNSTSFMCAGNITGQTGSQGQAGERGNKIFVLNTTRESLVNQAVNDATKIVGDVAITSDNYILRIGLNDATNVWLDPIGGAQNIKGAQGIQGVSGAAAPTINGISLVTNNSVDNCLRISLTNGQSYTTVQSVKGATGNDGLTPSIDAETKHWIIGETDTNVVAEGKNGRGIVSVIRTTGDGSPGTTDTYTITYTNGTSSTFTVYNGTNGTDATGQDGSRGTSIFVLSGQIENTTANLLYIDGDIAIDDSYYLYTYSSINGWQKSTSNIKGKDGNKILTSSISGAPNVNVGNIDDLCFSYGDYHVYKKTSSSLWTDLGCLKGETGDAGITKVNALTGVSYVNNSYLSNDSITGRGTLYLSQNINNIDPLSTIVVVCRQKETSTDHDGETNKYFSVNFTAQELLSTVDTSSYAFASQTTDTGNVVCVKLRLTSSGPVTFEVSRAFIDNVYIYKM